MEDEELAGISRVWICGILREAIYTWRDGHEHNFVFLGLKGETLPV